MTDEEKYNDIIAPMLLAVADKCDEFGMAMVAMVECGPGESWITQTENNGCPTGQKLTHTAAHCSGDMDTLYTGLSGGPGADTSMFPEEFCKLIYDGLKK